MRAAAAVVACLVTQSFLSAAVRQRGVSLPLNFEANRGQFPPYVGFVVRAGSETLALRTDGVLMHVARSADGDDLDLVELHLCGTRDAVGVGEELLPSVSHYYSGVTTDGWKPNVPHFGRVRFRQVYRGIDLVWTASRTIEYQFRVNPGADAGQIQFKIDGATKIRLDPVGNLIIESGAGRLRQHRPQAYQVVGGERRPVEARFRLTNARLSFDLGAYDRDLALIIDPTISISTYLGGSGYDAGYGIAVDSGGNLYITGETASADFLAVDAVAPARSNRDVFVTKLNSTASNIVYTTILSSSGDDAGRGIAVNESGEVWVTGSTGGNNFPVSSDSLQRIFTGPQSAFLTKLNSVGQLAYSTFLGGTPHLLSRVFCTFETGCWT